MNYNDAIKLADANNHLIGKKWDGATIDEIIIAPTNSELFAEFEKLYIQTLDAYQSIAPFTNFDVEVLVVFDKRRIRKQNFLGFTSIYRLPNSFSVIKEIEP